MWPRGPAHPDATGQTHDLHRLLNHREFLGYGMLAVLLAALVSCPYAMNFARRVCHEAVIAALSSGHLPWFMDCASRVGWRLDSYTDAATGTMAKNAASQIAMTPVQSRPATRFGPAHAPSLAPLQVLHHRAHAACFLANSVKTRVRCEPVPEISGAC